MSISSSHVTSFSTPSQENKMKKARPRPEVQRPSSTAAADDDDETPAAAHPFATATYADHVAGSLEGVDLNTRFADDGPEIVFVDDYTEPIFLLSTSNPAAVCIEIKQWLVESFSTRKLFAPGIVRLERQDLHSLPEDTQAWVMLAPDIASISTLPTSILGIFVPNDPNVRWFYTLLPLNPLLSDLLHPRKQFPPATLSARGINHHSRLTTYIRTVFPSNSTPPHAPAYLAAQTLTDYTPTSLERNHHLHHTRDQGLNLTHDRYLRHLPPAEREIASLAHLKCAEYLLLKRRFFRAFWVDVHRSSDDGKKKGVRSERAHVGWLEREGGMRHQRAKMLVGAWRELGFLEEEEGFGDWVRAGGLLAGYLAG